MDKFIHLRTVTWKYRYEQLFAQLDAAGINPVDVDLIVDGGSSGGLTSSDCLKHYPYAEVFAFDINPLDEIRKSNPQNTLQVGFNDSRLQFEVGDMFKDFAKITQKYGNPQIIIMANNVLIRAARLGLTAELAANLPDAANALAEEGVLAL